jgi:4-amino-4-deoxy-L-arabinose transferase-like glycosyltransferase
VDKNKYLWLGGVVVLGLALRFLVFAHFAKNPSENFLPGGKLGDAFWYDQIAVNILHGQGFSASVAEPYDPDPVRTPIYPLFLVAVYSLFGHELRAVVVVQILISMFSCILVFKIGCTVFGDFKTGIAAALMLAVEPDSLFISNHVLTETLFTCLLAGEFCLMAKQYGKLSLASLVGLFIIMAAATLTRPVFIFFPVFMAGFIVYQCFRSRLAKNCIALTLLPMALYFFLIGFWCYRNYRIFGVFEISTIGSYNLFYYNAAGIESRRLGISIDEARERLEETYFKNEKNIDSLSHSKKMLIARKHAIEHIMKYPLYFLKDAMSNMVSTFVPQGAAIKQLIGKGEKTGLRDIFEQEGIAGAFRQISRMDKSILALLAGISVVLLLIYASAVVGIVRALKNKHFYFTFLFLAAIAYLIIVPVLAGFGDARFRIPAVPFISLFAGYGIVRLIYMKGDAA